jgi:DNA-binding GntR family transcriptional regulator
MTRSTKKARIQEWVRSDLAENDYVPGSRLPYGVYEIGLQCDASTATVVYALQELGKLGVVDVRPHIGYFAVEKSTEPVLAPTPADNLAAARAALAAAQDQLSIAVRHLAAFPEAA